MHKVRRAGTRVVAVGIEIERLTQLEIDRIWQ